MWAVKVFSFSLAMGVLIFLGDAGTAWSGDNNHSHYGQTWYGSSTSEGLAVFQSNRFSSSSALYGHHEGAGYGVLGISRFGYGVAGGSKGENRAGVFGETFKSSSPGVYGYTHSIYGRGVYGYADDHYNTNWGVQGVSESRYNGVGVLGANYQHSGQTYGVYGYTQSGGGHAVHGWSISNSGYAGYFHGRVRILGSLNESSGSVQIDHPLNPENQYLSHSFVESPDMMNIYNGNITLNANGEAWVEMPDWFEALNQEFRYQLTPIGAPGPNLYIAEQIESNSFKIAGGQANMVVSWQVTGIRHDPYAVAHRVPVEETKPPEEQGTYLHPVEYSQPETMGLGYQHNQDLKTALSEIERKAKE